MLTRRIDAALQAMSDCRERLPQLCEIHRPGSAEREALEALLMAHRLAHHVLSRPLPKAPAP